MDTLRNNIEKELLASGTFIRTTTLEQILYSLIDQIERMDKDSTAGGMYREYLALKEEVKQLRDRVEVLEEVVCPYGGFGIDTNNLKECEIKCPMNRWNACINKNNKMTDNIICSKQA